MKKIKKILQVSFIKTLIFNLRYFGIKGLLFPCIVSRKTKLLKLGGNVVVNNMKSFKVFIGFGPEQATNGNGRFYNNGTIIFDYEAHLYDGFYIYNNGLIKLGKNFRLGSSKLFCEKEIEIDEDVMISWDCSLMDSDLHDIYYNKEKINFDEKISVGKHVWVCSNCHIYKGTIIADNCIVASDSHLGNIRLVEKNSIYGNFGKIIKKNINWTWDYSKNDMEELHD